MTALALPLPAPSFTGFRMFRGYREFGLWFGRFGFNVASLPGACAWDVQVGSVRVTLERLLPWSDSRARWALERDDMGGSYLGPFFFVLDTNAPQQDYRCAGR